MKKRRPIYKKVHFLYRAIGGDGISRLGYAASSDGFCIDERLPYSVYEHKVGQRPSFNIFSYFSGGSFGENLEIGGFVVKDKKIINQRIERVLEFFPDLKKKLKHKAGSLSGGQQQMLAFARGLMTDPKILLLDEPSLGLAPKIVKEVFAKIKEINERHKTAIMVVEHNIKSLLEIAHRGYVLDKGKIVKKDSAQNILQSDILEKVFTGKLN